MKTRRQIVFFVDGELFINHAPLKNAVAFGSKNILKIENYRHPQKRNSLTQEADIIKYLNKKGCCCCPKLIKEGHLKDGRRYIVLERITKQKGGGMPDLLSSMLEQKRLGVYHGDVNPNNIVFDGQTAFLVDYDQSEFQEDIVKMNDMEYVKYYANSIDAKWKTYFSDNFGLIDGADFIKKCEKCFDENGKLKTF